MNRTVPGNFTSWNPLDPRSLFKNLWTFLISQTEGNYHMYAYTKNKTLLGMSVEELRRESDRIKYRYLQMDSQHRCVPSDWYIIGYDIFVMHTFLRLSRTGPENDGYLKSYLDRAPQAFFVDYR
jgi:hypothetical protein